jgi:hypothetical protein
VLTPLLVRRAERARARADAPLVIHRASWDRIEVA